MQDVQDLQKEIKIEKKKAQEEAMAKKKAE